MRKFFAVAMGSVVALVGFAGAANASATVDLVWIDASATTSAGVVICLRPAKRNCTVLGSTIGVAPVVAPSDNITLAVILTPGPNDSIGGSASVDYSGTSGLSVTTFQSLTTTQPFFYLPLELGTAFDDGTGLINGLNAGAAPPAGAGIGLPSGVTAYLGTVSFHMDALVNGTFDILVGEFGGLDGFSDGTGAAINPTFNHATLINVPEPGALSLLVMGVGGMLLAGRGRRS